MAWVLEEAVPAKPFQMMPTDGVGIEWGPLCPSIPVTAVSWAATGPGGVGELYHVFSLFGLPRDLVMTSSEGLRAKGRTARELKMFFGPQAAVPGLC